MPVTIQPDDAIVSTDIDGMYHFSTDTGLHKVTVKMPGYGISSNPAFHKLDFESGEVYKQKDFALTVNDVADLGIVVTPIGRLRAFRPSSWQITIRNNGSLVTDGDVAFNFDKKLIFDSASITPKTQSRRLADLEY